MKRRNEVAVGVLVTVTVVMLIAGAIWLARGGFGTGYPLYMRTTWGQNLKEGQVVRLAGVNVGFVDGLVLGPGYLDVKLAITETKFKIPRGTVATVNPVGIFGDVEVTLTPPLPLPTAVYSSGDTIPAGASPASMGVILGRVDSIGRSVDRIMQALDQELVQAGGIRDMHRAMTELLAFGGQLQIIAARQDTNLTGMMRSFQETSQTFQQSAKRLASLVDSAAVDSTVKSARTTAATVARTSAELEKSVDTLTSIINRVNRGEGSLGGLLNSPTMLLQMQGTLASVQALIDDIKKNPSKYINVKLCC